MVDLVPMTEEEFHRFRERSVRDYAREGVRTGRWSETEAERQSRAEFAALVPQGRATPDHFFGRLRDPASGEFVGTVWYALRPAPGGRELFLFWLGIDPGYRRRGFARATLEQLAGEAGRIGAVRLALHVFGDNLPAIALYEQAGFRPASVLMTRPIGGPADPSAPRRAGGTP